MQWATHGANAKPPSGQRAGLLRKLGGEFGKKMFAKRPEYGIVKSCGGRESGYGEAIRLIYDFRFVAVGREPSVHTRRPAIENPGSSFYSPLFCRL